MSKSFPVPASVTAFLAEPQKLFIGGEWVDAASGETMDLINPSTGKTLATAPLGGAVEIDAAVRAARRAFDSGPWGKMPYTERRRLLLALADAIEAELVDFSMIDSLNMGMPAGPARFIIGELSVESLRYNAGWAGKVSGETLTTAAPDHHAYTLKEPLGVIGAIVPWNSPLMAAMGKLAPALAAGCTVVLKPSEVTPLSVFKLSKLIKAVGIPDGVVNIVNGLGHVAGQALVEHPLVDKIAFTGSTATGKAIVRTAADTMKRVGLELGGKSPVFIFGDADLEKAIEAAAAGIFRNAGQICAAGSRVYAHKSVFDKVVAGVAERAAALKVGDALDYGVQMGPIVSARQLDRVLGYLDSGRKEGVEVVSGGARIDAPGFFVQPTVFVRTDQDMSVVREEIFGPVVGIQPFEDDDLEQVAAIGNDTAYGLAAYLWTSKLSTAHQMAKKLKAGLVMINGGSALDRGVPFGGFKQSGWGREYGLQGVEAYLEPKSVTIAL